MRAAFIIFAGVGCFPKGAEGHMGETRSNSRGRADPTVETIAGFIEYVSRLALSDRLRQRFAGTARVVTGSDLQALRVLDRGGPMTYGELAGHLLLDRTTISRMAARLLSAELVSRVTDEEDKRKAWLAVTSAGRKALARVEAVYIEFYEVAIADWSPADRAAARRVLVGLQDRLARLDIDESGRAAGLAPSPLGTAAPSGSKGRVRK